MDDMSELVSIVIPAFNAGRFIGRALNSVLAQSHAKWEIVVVEDGTHDETESVVREFAASVSQSVRYENNGSNLGVSATRNRAKNWANSIAMAPPPRMMREAGRVVRAKASSLVRQPVAARPGRGG